MPRFSLRTLIELTAGVPLLIYLCWCWFRWITALSGTIQLVGDIRIDKALFYYVLTIIALLAAKIGQIVWMTYERPTPPRLD